MRTTAPVRPSRRRPAAPFDRHTLNQIFFEAIDRFGPQEALRFKRDGRWQSLSYREVELRVAHVAALLEGWHLEPGDRVAILSENRPEWAIVDYAALALGLIVVPIYPTLPADQVEFILQRRRRPAGLRLERDTAGEAGPSAPGCPAWSGSWCSTRTPRETASPPWSRCWSRPTSRSRVWSRELRKRAYGVRPRASRPSSTPRARPATPKGVVLTHENLASMIAASRQHGSLATRPGMVALSLLPLSHVLERAGDYYYWDNGVTIAYAESVATRARQPAGSAAPTS